MAGMPFPQGDRTALRKTSKTPTGPDDNTKTKIANASATAPFLPDRDGPAKDSMGGKVAGKPKTSAPAKKAPPKMNKKMAAMKASLKAL